MSLLVDLQDTIKTRLETDSMFDPDTFGTVPVVSLSQGDVSERINAAITTKGILVVILTPSITRRPTDAQTVRVLVHIVEKYTLNRTSNGTNHAIEDVAETVEDLLNKWQTGAWGQMQFVQSQLLSVPDLISKKPIEWQVTFDLTLIPSSA